jgi:hypothetical protein
VGDVGLAADIADLGLKGDEARLDADVNAGDGKLLTRVRSALRDRHS